MDCGESYHRGARESKKNSKEILPVLTVVLGFKDDDLTSKSFPGRAVPGSRKGKFH
jgi:hypothetical protein